MHVGLARHGELAIVDAAPEMFAAMPRLMAEYVILLDSDQPANQPAPVDAEAGGKGMDTVLRLLGTVPQLLAPLLDCLAYTATVHKRGASGTSGTHNPRVIAVAPAVRALAAAHCLQCILAAQELRLAVLAVERSVKRMLDVLAKVPDDDVTVGTSAVLRTLCAALRNSAQDAFGRGL